jgi:hypothetical protein
VGNDVVKNGKIVTDTSRQKEKIPGGVMKKKALPGEKIRPKL